MDFEREWISVLRFWKEPLFHFIIGAMLIFAYFWITGASRNPLSYEINITRSDIDRIASDAIRTSNRLPTHDEISALVDQNIKEEIYYREALRLGLDDGDAVIKRRLSNKMRSLNNASINEPSDKDLQKWLDENPDQYAPLHQYAFRQLYIGRNTSLETQEKWLNQLRIKSIEPQSIKVALSIAEEQKLSNQTAIQRKFGAQFTEALSALKTNQWQGPIESGFGMHFIFIDTKKTDEIPVLGDIRQRVVNDWRAAEISQAEKSAYEELASQYDIEIAEFQ